MNSGATLETLKPAGVITDARLASLKPGEWLRDPAPKGAGRLLARKTKAGATIFYFRYTLPTGERDTLPLGTYEAKSKGGFSLKEIRLKSSELSRLYQAGTKNIRTHVEHLRKAESETVDTESMEATRTTLKSLIAGYCDDLQQRGKVSASGVRSELNHYVVDQFDALCQRPAKDLIPRDFNPLFEGMISRGIGRTTAKIRSHLHAAYQTAMRAENDPTSLKSLRGFGIITNPISAIPAMSQFNVPGERALTRKEFAGYLREVRALSSRPTRTALLLAVLLGGQRMQQLLRLEFHRVDMDGYPVIDSLGNEQSVKTLMLLDGKGRRKKPRLHVLPLFGEAEVLVEAMRLANPGSSYVFTSDGETPMVGTTPSHAVCAISKKLVASKEIARGFKLADVRRTCETLLSKLRVHKDVRAQIQSHGLGGVQDRHYDKNDYIEEKYQAFAVWVADIAQIEAEFIKK